MSTCRVNAAETAMPWAESMLQKQQCRGQSQCCRKGNAVGRVNAAGRGNAADRVNVGVESMLQTEATAE